MPDRLRGGWPLSDERIATRERCPFRLLGTVVARSEAMRAKNRRFRGGRYGFVYSRTVFGAPLLEGKSACARQRRRARELDCGHRAPFAALVGAGQSASVPPAAISGIHSSVVAPETVVQKMPPKQSFTVAGDYIGADVVLRHVPFKLVVTLAGHVVVALVIRALAFELGRVDTCGPAIQLVLFHQLPDPRRRWPERFTGCAITQSNR